MSYHELLAFEYGSMSRPITNYYHNPFPTLLHAAIGLLLVHFYVSGQLTTLRAGRSSCAMFKVRCYFPQRQPTGMED
jgi:hypothetical protein